MESNKVTIITPVFNSERFIRDTILTVAQQTYSNWEMILVDDCSTDRSAAIIDEETRGDERFRYYKLERNSGAAAARNFALEKSDGRFVAFLDADDLWRSDKTEKQVRFMLDHNVAFCCTDYEVIDEVGNLKNKIVHIPQIVDYNLFLRNTIIQTVGVMVDTQQTGKALIRMTLERKEGASSREDAATWCNLLKHGYPCYAMNENLAYYRRVSDSLSSNKVKSFQGTWHLYRQIEKLPLLKSCYCFVGYAYNATKKRIYMPAIKTHRVVTPRHEKVNTPHEAENK